MRMTLQKTTPFIKQFWQQVLYHFALTAVIWLPVGNCSMYLSIPCGWWLVVLWQSCGYICDNFDLSFWLLWYWGGQNPILLKAWSLLKLILCGANLLKCFYFSKYIGFFFLQFHITDSFFFQGGYKDLPIGKLVLSLTEPYVILVAIISFLSTLKQSKGHSCGAQMEV